MLANVGDRLIGWDAVEHGEAGEGRARPSAPASARQLDPFVEGSPPRTRRPEGRRRTPAAAASQFPVILRLSQADQVGGLEDGDVC